jgi:hypothetical protein
MTRIIGFPGDLYQIDPFSGHAIPGRLFLDQKGISFVSLLLIFAYKKKEPYTGVC